MSSQPCPQPTIAGSITVRRADPERDRDTLERLAQEGDIQAEKDEILIAEIPQSDGTVKYLGAIATRVIPVGHLLEIRAQMLKFSTASLLIDSAAADLKARGYDEALFYVEPANESMHIFLKSKENITPQGQADLFLIDTK